MKQGITDATAGSVTGGIAVNRYPSLIRDCFHVLPVVTFTVLNLIPAKP